VTDRILHKPGNVTEKGEIRILGTTTSAASLKVGSSQPGGLQGGKITVSGAWAGSMRVASMLDESTESPLIKVGSVTSDGKIWITNRSRTDVVMHGEIRIMGNHAGKLCLGSSSNSLATCYVSGASDTDWQVISGSPNTVDIGCVQIQGDFVSGGVIAFQGCADGTPTATVEYLCIEEDNNGTISQYVCSGWSGDVTFEADTPCDTCP